MCRKPNWHCLVLSLQQSSPAQSIKQCATYSCEIKTLIHTTSTIQVHHLLQRLLNFFCMQSRNIASNFIMLFTGFTAPCFPESHCENTHLKATTLLLCSCILIIMHDLNTYSYSLKLIFVDHQSPPMCQPQLQAALFTAVVNVTSEVQLQPLRTSEWNDLHVSVIGSCLCVICNICICTLQYKQVT